METYTFAKPLRIAAGKSGNDTLYHRCAECDDDMIAGFLGTAPNWESIAVLGTVFPYRLALYCEKCLPHQAE